MGLAEKIKLRFTEKKELKQFLMLVMRKKITVPKNIEEEIEQMFGVYAHDGESPMTETHSDLKSAQTFLWGDDSCGESEGKNPHKKNDALILRPVSWRYLVPQTGSRPKEKCRHKAA